jgi:hypothetical protein
MTLAVWLVAWLATLGLAFLITDLTNPSAL